MKRMKNLKLRKDFGEKNTTNETKNLVKSREWIIIGDKKVWVRVCQSCKSVVHYTKSSNLRRAIRLNSECPKCRCLGVKNPFYGGKHTDKTKEILSNQKIGRLNPMYKIGGMVGKKHSNSTIQKQIVARQIFWKKLGHECKNLFLKYRWEVDRLTRKQPIEQLVNFDKRGKAGINGAYHLDHIYSVWNGFNKNLPPEYIADITNLQFIPWMENQKKWYK